MASLQHQRDFTRQQRVCAITLEFTARPKAVRWNDLLAVTTRGQ